MDFSCCHLVIRAADIPAARDFYVAKLELPVLEDVGNFFAVRAGDVRLSIFPTETKAEPTEEDLPGVSIVLKTANVEEAKSFLVGKGLVPLQDIVEAPNFMKFLTLADPDNNVIFFAEYLADPMEPK